MAGVWPNLDAADLEARVRTYLNESVAGFYTQAEIWRWLSIAAKDIAQKTLCVKRVLDAQTASSTRTVTTNAYKVIYVEYIPSSGRNQMLIKIDPLRVGHYPINGTTPQYWYEFGSTIGIEPLPDATYELRLYVADMPKMVALTFTTFTGTWSGTGWTAGSTLAHVGTGPDDATYATATLTASTNYTVSFTTSGVGTGGSVTPKLGTTSGVAVTTAGYHTQTITSSSGTPSLIMTGANTIIVDDMYVWKEADYAAVGDQTELPTAWQHLLALYATYNGLMKDKKPGPAKMLESIYNNELMYLRQNIVEIIPDGRNDQKYR